MKIGVTSALLVALVAVFDIVPRSEAAAPPNFCEIQTICWTLVGNELNGQTRKIFNPTAGKFWHNNGWGDKKISTRYQPEDAFVYMDMFRQSDGSYKFRDFGTFICDGYGTSMKGLHTKESSCTSEDHFRFYIYTNTRTGTYQIKSKATNRYVRLDASKYEFVTTIENNPDDRAVFQFLF